MTLEQFTNLVEKYRKDGRAFKKFTPDTNDVRFGIQNKSLAMIYKQQKASVVFTFRVGLISSFIKKFQALGAEAAPHSSLEGMFTVTIHDEGFSPEINQLLEECVSKAMSKFYQS